MNGKDYDIAMDTPVKLRFVLKSVNRDALQENAALLAALCTFDQRSPGMTRAKKCSSRPTVAR